MSRRPAPRKSSASRRYDEAARGGGSIEATPAAPAPQEVEPEPEPKPKPLRLSRKKKKEDSDGK